MTLEESEFDERNCFIKRKGSNCRMKSIVELETIPPELINSGCVKISYNIYDFFNTCGYTTTTTNKSTTTTSTLTLPTPPTTTLTSTLTTTNTTTTNKTSISNTTPVAHITSILNLFSKFLSWFIADIVVIFAFIIPGIGYYIKRKQFDPSSSSIHSIQSSLFNSVSIQVNLKHIIHNLLLN
jgi:hypothetical protein